MGDCKLVQWGVWYIDEMENWPGTKLILNQNEWPLQLFKTSLEDAN